MHKPNPLVERAELSLAYFIIQEVLCIFKVSLPPLGPLLLSSVENEKLQKGTKSESLFILESQVCATFKSDKHILSENQIQHIEKKLSYNKAHILQT